MGEKQNYFIASCTRLVMCYGNAVLINDLIKVMGYEWVMFNVLTTKQHHRQDYSHKTWNMQEKFTAMRIKCSIITNIFIISQKISLHKKVYVGWHDTA